MPVGFLFKLLPAILWYYYNNRVPKGDHFVRRVPLLCCFILIVSLTSGCMAAALRPASLPAQTEPVLPPAPSPAPTPETVVADEAALAASFAVDFTECGFLPCDASPAGVLSNRPAALALADTLRARAQDACDILGDTRPGQPVSPAISAPGWQWLCGLYHGYGANAGDALQACLRLNVTQRPGGVSLHVAWENPIDDATLRAGDRTSLFSAHFMTCYLNTAYDANGLEREEQEKFPLDTVPGDPLFFPLPGREKRVKNDWYDGRTEDTRYHMGTDIKAPEGTPILACRGGEVLLIGYHDIPGYYVVVRDAAGYEYHYYHMVRLTDFLAEGQVVAAGDLLGHVGDTGNSDTDHLHLSIISPQGEHINPYLPMKAAARTAP